MPRKYPNENIYARVDMVPSGMRTSDEIRFIANATESFFREASDKLAEQILRSAQEKAKTMMNKPNETVYQSVGADYGIRGLHYAFSPNVKPKKKELSTVNQLWSEVNEWLKDIKLEM
jgi:hypothetical protein